MTQIPMDRMLGVTYGLAYGDALGRPTEFMKAASLEKFGNPFRRQVGLTRPTQGIVTDDTQMSLAIGRAALGDPDPKQLTASFIRELIRWHGDPKSRDGKRAPGMTCLSAVGRLKRDPKQWLLATDTDSKGNGANMRVSPLALRTDWTYRQISAAAQMQAALTHGHATALAAADLTAVAVRMLLEDVAKPGPALLDHLLAYAHDQRNVYHGDWLGHLWEHSAKQVPFSWGGLGLPLGGSRTGRLWEDDASWPIGAVVRNYPAPRRRAHRPAPKSPQEFIERGWDKLIDCLLRIYDVPRNQHQDPCRVGGEGWVAEEALMVALHTLLCFPDDPTNALRRAAFTSGDSDSIASITGALAGAAYGRRYFPHGWIENLEYRREIDSLTARLANAAGC
jgi:ADP-ribosylglycohydrolase